VPSHPDDPSIKDEDNLWRRFPPRYVVGDGKGGLRPTSQAFHHGDGGEISVNVEGVAELDSITARYPQESVAAVKARIPREKRYTVLYVEDPGNPGHAEIWPPERLTEGKRKCAEHMAKNAVIVYMGGSPTEPI
jgi:hypothetical protein